MTKFGRDLQRRFVSVATANLLDMSEPGELESRVSDLEQRVDKLTDELRGTKQDAAAARILAGGADRDVNELGGDLRDFRQAATTSLNALRADVRDLRDHVDGKFADVDGGFGELRGKLDGVAAGQEQIVRLLGVVIEQHSPNDGES